MGNHNNLYVALLRGINVGGKNRLPMAQLRSLVEASGGESVATYIQSGNVVFRSDKNIAQLESELEQAIEKTFDLSIPVLVRSADKWSRYLDQNPFPAHSAKTPNWVQICLSKKTPAEDAQTGIADRATRGELVKRAGDAIWIWFPEGIGRSKLTPAVLDRCCGSPVTARNFKTVQKLQSLVESRDA